MRVYSLICIPISLLAASTNAALNGHCENLDGPYSDTYGGICIHTQTCDDYGGTYGSGACPDDPEDVKCCFVNSCDPKFGEGYSYCDWTSHQCAWGGTENAHWVSGLCPGGNDYKCCTF